MVCCLCTACGMQYPEADAPPERCPICEDERQFVPPGGQSWTTLESLRVGHSNAWRLLAPDLFAVQTFPAIAIGRRRATCSGTAPPCSTKRRKRWCGRWAGWPQSPSRTRITT